MTIFNRVPCKSCGVPTPWSSRGQPTCSACQTQGVPKEGTRRHIIRSIPGDSMAAPIIRTRITLWKEPWL